MGGAGLGLQRRRALQVPPAGLEVSGGQRDAPQPERTGSAAAVEVARLPVVGQRSLRVARLLQQPRVEHPCGGIARKQRDGALGGLEGRRRVAGFEEPRQQIGPTGFLGVQFSGPPERRNRVRLPFVRVEDRAETAPGRSRAGIRGDRLPGLVDLRADPLVHLAGGRAGDLREVERGRKRRPHDQETPEQEGTGGSPEPERGSTPNRGRQPGVPGRSAASPGLVHADRDASLVTDIGGGGRRRSAALALFPRTGSAPRCARSSEARSWRPSGIGPPDRTGATAQRWSG